VTVAGGEAVNRDELDKFAPLVKPETVELTTRPPPPAPGGVKLPPAGGDAKPAPNPIAGAVDRARKSNDLKQIGLAYHSYLSTNNKPPARAEDLAPFYENNVKITTALKDGTYVVYWNVKLMSLVNGTSNTILGYEKDAPAKGGEVLYADGHVATLTAAEFAKAAKPPGQ
jgi:prepilin-type processing-associated H-X9-DG protein